MLSSSSLPLYSFHTLYLLPHAWKNYILASTHLIPSSKILAYKFLGFARAGFVHISVKWNERKNSVCTHAYQMCKQVNSLLKASAVLCSFRFITSSLHFVKLFSGYGIVNNLKNATFFKNHSRYSYINPRRPREGLSQSLPPAFLL